MATTLTEQAIELATSPDGHEGSPGFTIPDDAARLLRYAEELEAQAVDLDRRTKECG